MWKNDQASSSSSSSLRPTALKKPEESIYDFGYPRPQDEGASPVAYNMVLKAGSFSYSRFGNDDYGSFKDLEIGWDHGDFENDNKRRPYMIRWKSGKKVDQRLLMVLESFFQEIYVKRDDFFKKIFPGVYGEFVDVFNKIGAMLWKNNDQVKSRALQRSLSVGSPRSLEWFAVKTPNVILGDPAGPKGSQTDTASGK
ncbi:hypothetical protein ACH5RR_016454 [Cinchona calisaya]|uniref:Uncharacterized protein n=1 Tax=Cinchona calisaya TaxID=153742 RepID=A0ABD2ZZE9_9GENT